METWQPRAASGATKRRRSSSKPDSNWHVDGEAGHEKDQREKGRRKTPEENSSPRHALDHRDHANDRHAAAMSGENSSKFNTQMAKAEKAMLYRMRFEGEYMKKKQRDFDKHSQAEDEQRQMEANKAAVEARIKSDREHAQDQLRRRKMIAQNRVVERSLSTGLAAFKRVKKAQKDAKRYSDTHVLLSEQYSHLNFLVQQKQEQIQTLESEKRLKFLRQQQNSKFMHHTNKNHAKHKRKGASASNKSASIKLRNAVQSGDNVPHLTIHQQAKEVEKYQHVVEHRLRNLGENKRELVREREEINRLRRSLKQKRLALTQASKDKVSITGSLEEQRQAYTNTSSDCDAIEVAITELKQAMESDKDQFGTEWDDRMDTLTDYHREATRQVEDIGGQSRSRAKSMRTRKLSHLPMDRHSRLMGLTGTMNEHHSSTSHKNAMNKDRKKVKTMDEAFSFLSRATGIESLEELVDTFVHADRRNYSVVKHITALDRDVDELGAELRDLKAMRKRLEHEQHKNGLSRRQKVTAMARELEGLKRQIEVAVAAHDRDKRVVSNIGPQVHDLFFQLGCRDNTVPETYESAFMTDRNLMRMLGLVDQQTVLLMSMFSQLELKLAGSNLENITNTCTDTQQQSINAQALRSKHSTLSRKPEPPKMGDFDDDDSDSDGGGERMEALNSESDSSSSSSSDSDDEFLSKKEKRKRAKKKVEKKKLKAQEKKRRTSMSKISQKQRSSRLMEPKSAVQKPEPISNLRKKVQRQIESGNHRHHHGSVIRFEPTRGKDHFKKRETVPIHGPVGIGLGITPEQLASLQGLK